MQIREGAYYRTRGGQVFGPMIRWVEPNTNYPWCVCFTEHENCWTEAGCWSENGREYPLDLVAEVYVSDTPPVVKETEEELREMMRDPRYWRQRDPDFVKRVTDGFRALVGGDTPPDSPKGSMLKPQDWRRIKPIEPSPETKTLRDEFAGRVLTGMMADHTAPNKPPEFFADLAYKYANAMMEARKK